MSQWYIPEILSHIRSYADLPDFAAFCQTSKWIYCAGRSLLYHSIDLFLDNQRPETLILLYRTLEKMPDLASHVKSLRIDFSSSRDASQSALLPRILDLCTQIRAIGVIHPYALLDPVAPEINRSLSKLRHLRELEFRNSKMEFPRVVLPGGPDVNVSLFVQALGIKSLETISLTIQQARNGLLPAATLGMSANSNITRLRLSTSYLSVECLSNMLHAFLQLKHLSLSLLWAADPINPEVGRHLDCEKLGQALSHRSHTLESLEVAVYVPAKTALDVTSGSGKGSNWGLLHNIGVLQSFTRLESLLLAPEVLLGWDEQEALPLADLLPDSLRHLHFRWDFGDWELAPWYLDSLCEVLVSYLDSSPSQTLESLVLTCYDYELSELADHFEPVRSKCEEKHIRARLETIPDWLSSRHIR